MTTSPYAEFASPDAPTITNESGGKQSHTPLRFDLIPPVELAEVAKVLGEGAEKYGECNWKLIATNDHLNHAVQHVYAFLAGDTSDAHLAHATCRLLFAMFTSKGEAVHTDCSIDRTAFNYIIQYIDGLEQTVTELANRVAANSAPNDTVGETICEQPGCS